MARAEMTLVLAAAVAFSAVGTALSQDPSTTREAALADIEATFGFVPEFVQRFPAAALPGAWAELKAVEISADTALPAKTKALIAIAVAAQIPCQYCVWIDTKSAYLAGATDQEIQEAVAMAALVRHWSTVFHGTQVDFDAFKTEFGALAAAADQARTKTMAQQ